MGGGGSKETQTDPWGPQGDQLEFLYTQARSLYNEGPRQYPPGGTVADRHPYSTAATQNTFDIANNQGLQAAIENNQATLRGDFRSPFSNPHLREVGDTAAEDITRSFRRGTVPMIASRFGGAGRSAGPETGGNAEMSALADAERGLGGELSQMYANLYGGAYERGMDREQTAVGQSIDLRGREFQDQQALSAAGRDEFMYSQMQLNDAVQGFNFEQYAPYEQLGLFKDFIAGGSYGSSSTFSATPGPMQYTGLGIAGAGALAGAVNNIR